jgi:hypothetical protein
MKWHCAKWHQCRGHEVHWTTSDMHAKTTVPIDTSGKSASTATSSGAHINNSFSALSRGPTLDQKNRAQVQYAVKIKNQHHDSNFPNSYATTCPALTSSTDSKMS